MAAETIAQTAFRKIIWRLMPLLTVSYILNYLDRGNIGFAALQMNHQLGLSAAQFGVGAGILSLGYCTFEIPSNLALYRFGARKWIARIMITWGFVAAGCALIQGPASFYSIRFLLGVTEAGFFPGIAFLLSQWFPAEYRARMLAILLLGVPVSSVVGGPVSGALLGLDQIGGLAGWQWMFIIEGLPTIVLGFVVLWALADSPATASWLTPEEKTAVQAQIAAEPRHKPVSHLWTALKDPRVLILALIQFGFTTGSYGVGIWLPQIIKTHFHDNLTVGFVSAGPYIIASIAMLVWAGIVDRSGKRIGNLILTCGLATVGLVLSVVFAEFWLSFFWLTVALVGITAARAVFWTVPARFLTGVAAAGGLAFINSIGTIGGFVGPAAVGWLKSATGSFSAGLIGMAGFLLLSAVLAVALRLFVPRE
ncbi:MFS transporter [Acidisphaera sp. S103]|uniref:MFS transporter n=1 Tax=Acidisphaera sp. S103 TaxID=1747223 RepID=UPI00131AD5C2|nr:MFS transporter [Acidisphaera sp. S103]